MFIHKRQQLEFIKDKYYTKSHVVRKCLKVIDFDRYDCIIEPSAGNGAFIKGIHHKNIIALDIEPEQKSILKKDWFDYTIKEKYKNVLVVGNPPFGLNHSLSDSFIQHALKFSNVQTISFILPNTYKKHTRQKIIPRNWRISHIVDIGKDAFIYENNTYHNPCSFFVFDKSNGNDLRFKVEKRMYKESIDFYFSTIQDYDFFIFGACPNKIIKTPTQNNRGYHIKTKIQSEEVIKRLQQVNWKGNSCAHGGVAWFTKPEIVSQYENFILNNYVSNVSNHQSQL